MKFNRLLALPALVCAAVSSLQTAAAATEWRPGVPRTAFVTMFEYSWDSVAKECTNFLGPKGYAAVQVSPPQEHGPGGEWWRRYQPVSYKLVSRSGDRAKFQNMINTCKTAGVDVYVDTVINHMADYNGGTGTAGSPWSARNFPGVPFSSQDFHSPKCDIADSDYSNNRGRVVNCDMPGLPDLNTGSAYVQDKIAAYLNDMRSLGVAGFRIDAAKHISPADLGAIKAKVPGSYFFTQEVIRDGTVGGAGSGDMAGYQNLGTVNEFNYIYAMKNAFLNREGFSVSRLPEIFNTWGFLPSNQATVFVNNHDTERKMCSGYSMGSVCDSLSTFNGDKLYLANVFMLAYTYGYPTVATGYYFNNHDMGPQGQPYSGTEAAPANCSSSYQVGKWDCVHRDRRVANMVGFRNYVNGTAIANWSAEGTDRVSFQRGNKGFVAINNSSSAWQKTFATGLPDGAYCNVLASDNPETGSCSGATVNVSGGQATVSVNANSAVALHIGAKVGTPSDTTAPSVPANLVKGTVTSTSVALSWSASTDNTGGSGMAGYRIFRNGTQVGTSTGTSFTNSGLTASTTYSYTVRAYDQAGNVSAASAPLSVTTLASGGSNTATVYYYRTDWASVNIHYAPTGGTWTTAPGVAMDAACTNYKVKVINLGTATGLAATFNNGSSWDNNGGNNYQLGTGVSLVKGGVITVNAANPCAADTIVPTTPTALTKGTVTSTSAALSWTASTDTGGSGLAGYRIYRNGVQVGTSTGTSFTNSGLTPSTTYSYTVRAVDGAGNLSAASTALSVTTSAGACTVNVAFTIANANTVVGQSLYVVGNQTNLGNWTPANGFKLTIQGSGANVPWTGTVALPANVAVQYKFVKWNGSTAVWESNQATTSGNRQFTTSATCGSTTTRNDGNFKF